jgi:RNA polymerase-binding transcription factor DksA
MSDILDNIGQIINEVGESVDKLGNKAVSKSKSVAEAAKLNAKLLQAKSAIQAKYYEIGKLYCDKYAETPAPDFTEAVDAVNASKAVIADIQTKILAAKGYVKCPVCGNSVPFEYDFCGKCGTKIEKPAPEPEVVDEPETVIPDIEVIPDDEV